MRRSILLLSACLAFAAMSGCGNKGPLYLPPPAPKAPAHAAANVSPASASTVAKPAGEH